MQYKNFIKVDENFQYSINLQFDFNSLPKINGYIPTSSSIEVLETYIQNIYSDKAKDRTTVLIGPYGKGKSHLLLVLLGILSLSDSDIDNKSGLNAKDVMDSLISKISKIDESSAEKIKDLRQEKKRLLPIIINSNYSDLNQAFLMALKDALERFGISNLIPSTYFNEALKTIERWESGDFQEAERAFKRELKNSNFKSKAFKRKLENFDEEAYTVFKEIYPVISAGAEFNPLINSNIVSLYEEVNIKLCNETDFSGMFIVFDEFSKFIEGTISTNAAKDLKVIQELGELTHRSDKNQMHCAFITHKSIGDYISNVPKEQLDGWRTVEGRIKELYFTSTSVQNYELIANAIHINPESFHDFIEENKDSFKEVNEIFNFSNLFDNGEQNLITKQCFPLNPITTYALPRVSEKVAQNERTLFTFIAKDEPGSLGRIIKENTGTMDILNLNTLYDYFEVLFRKELFHSYVHNIYVKASSALSKIKENDEKKVVKALAIIYVINELEKVSPNSLTIAAALNLEHNECKNILHKLENKKLIVKKRSTEYFDFLPGNSADVVKDIQNYKALKVTKVNSINVLENIVSLGYIIPKRYNDQYEMTRFFKKAFISAERIQNISYAEELLNFYNSDGVIFHLIYTNEAERDIAVNKIKELNDERILICIPKKPFNKIDTLKEYEAIQIIKKEKADATDENYSTQELGIFEEDIISDIENYIKDNFNIASNKCKIYSYIGEIKNISKQAYLNKFISDICSNVFNRTPVINNELINKSKLTSPILKARDKILKFIFEEWDICTDGIVGSSPEATIFRALIKNKGLMLDNQSNDEGLNDILNEVRNFLSEDSGNKKCFKDLYDILEAAPYGIRKGIIPVYIAYIMKDFKEEIVIYYGEKEVPLSLNTLNKINETPDKYYLLMEIGTSEKMKYIDQLSETFKQYRSSKEIGYNKFGSLVDAIQNWMQSLPKYTRQYTVLHKSDKKSVIEVDVAESIQMLRKELLTFEINPREFLFVTVMQDIIKTNTYDKCFMELANIKNELDTFISKVNTLIIKETKILFNKTYKGELSSLLTTWYKDLNEKNKNHLYDINANSFLKYISNLNTFNDTDILNKLSLIATNLSIEDWNDSTFDIYKKEIRRIKYEVETYKEAKKDDSVNTFEINLNIDGQKVSKNFAEGSISKMGNTLFNDLESTLDDFGDAIDINEKRNILMKLLEKFM